MTDNHQGLSPAEVLESRQTHGPNTLTPPQRESMWRLFLSKFKDPIIRILMIAAVLSLGISAVHGQYYETVGIIVAILLSTSIAFYFERDAAKKFSALNQVNESTLYKVYRSGALHQIPKSELVVGDILTLDTGEEIPADCELLESMELSMNESSLTGEPLCRKTTTREDFDAEATYPSNHILRGTTIMEGSCTARIIRVGDSTEFGRVSTLSTQKVEGQTPLTMQLERLAKIVGVCGFTIALVMFVGLIINSMVGGNLSSATLAQKGFLGATLFSVFIMMGGVWMPILIDAKELLGRGHKKSEKLQKMTHWSWLRLGFMMFLALSFVGLAFGAKAFEASSWISLDQAHSIIKHFMLCVTLIVVAVPEGLPMSVTLSLALSMRKMLRAQNLVRRMHATETIGAATIICTDKTGTLTENQMRVSELQLLGGTTELLHSAIAVNSTANLDVDGKPIGNPTESAMLLWLKSQNINYTTLRHGISGQLPFSSKLKMMATVATIDGQEMLVVKGAPEYILECCTGGDYTAIREQLLGYQNRAMRTLAFAYKPYTGGEIKDELQGLTLQAIAAIADPVRVGVEEAVRSCQSAGIQIKMITGDTMATALEIARLVGIWDAKTDTPENCITGPEWEALSDSEALQRAPHIKVMSRARPQDKQRLVQMLQQLQEVVAVTGDGTNDAPALNFADVGLSMGTGTSVAKEASDITLLDDSFQSIANAVLWGRSVYLNIQRFVLFQLTINIAAVLIVIIGEISGIPMPLTVTQMLWVNIIMDTFAAGALASLPADKSTMTEKPRKKSQPILTKPMTRQIIGVGVAFVGVMIAVGVWFKQLVASGTNTPLHFQTIFFTVFVMLQFWNMFNAKAYKSRKSALSGLKKSSAFIVVALLILLGQWIIVTVGGEVFRVQPLPALDWITIIAATSAVLWIGEIARLIKTKKITKA